MRLITTLGMLFVSPAIASAQLSFTKPVADLGELRGSLVYQHRFDFVNDSKIPLEIVDVRLGCGCLLPVYEKRVYQPGEKGALLMHVRTLGQPNGARTWQAHVQYRHGNKQHESLLVLAAKIRNEVTIEPSIIAMTVETTLKQELTITDLRAMPFKVTNIVASSAAVRVASKPMANGVTQVTLEVTGAALPASRQEAMLNIYTDDPYYRHLQVPITLTRATRSAVSAIPNRIAFDNAGSQLVRLRASGENAVRIDKIEADHPALKCTWAAGPGNDATLKIASGAFQEPMQTSVRVHIGATVVTIPVTLRRE